MSSSRFYQRTAIAAAIAACFPGLASAAPVARVDFAVGPVSAVAADGRARQLTKGSEIEVGDTVKTQAGRAQLRFTDGAYMSLQPQTDFKVEEYKYSGKENPSDNIVMNLLRGGMRTITGAIGRANRANYKMRTEVATIGIRGTEYSVKYTNSIEVYCANGTITVQNEGGTLTLNGGQGGFVGNNNAQPQRTSEKPDLPPQQPSEKKEEPPIAPPSNPFVPPVENLLTGTHDLNMAFASADICSDGCEAVIKKLNNTGTLDASGALVSFLDGSVTISGATSIASSGNDGIIAWGRWTSGTVAGGGPDFFGTMSLDSAPLHYIVGLPATDIPTSGTGVYNMIGATPPTLMGSLTSGSVTSSSLTFNFASTAVTFNLGMTLDGTAVSASLGLTRTGAGFGGSGFVFPGGPFSSCGANLQVQGFLAGAGASRAGAAYLLHDSFSGNGATGVIAYKKQ
jgi:hypothetical protein